MIRESDSFSYYMCPNCGVFSDKKIVCPFCSSRLKRQSIKTYMCYVCGYAGNYDDVNIHVWEEHRQRFINHLISSMDGFIVAVSIRFISRYNLKADYKDISQFLRTNIFILLRDSYNPKLGRAEHFAKASCSIFLKRYLQEYHYKYNSIHNMPYKSVYDTPEHEHFSEGDMNKNIDKHNIIDHRVIDPIDSMVIDDYNILFKALLKPIEWKIYEYITDDSYPFTQDEIAISLGISQPMVSYRVRIIRRKIRELLDSLL